MRITSLARVCALIAVAAFSQPSLAFNFTVHYGLYSCATPPAGQAQCGDLDGSGFLDHTPVSPVGGNTGTTRGDQRKQAFEFALNEWAERLQSNVTVKVNAGWADQTCSASSGVLGQAGPQLVVFAGAPQANTFYPLALADALKGSAVAPSLEDIDATFDLNVDNKPGGGCLGTKVFYYGLDENTGSNISFINVAVHELGHGLGFVSLIDPSTGASEDTQNHLFAIMDYKLFDETTAKFMVTTSGGSTQDTQSERQTVITSNGSLVFNATNTNSGSAFLSAGRTGSGHVRMFAPNPVQSGSSISHWDSVATPNLVMEPTYSQIDASQHVDLTTCAFEDIGWQLCGTWACPDTSGNGGSCAGANTPPTLTQIANQTINEDGNTGALAFTVGDAETAVNSLTTSASSNNTTLVPNVNLALGGSGANRTITVTPTANRSGSATITYTVNDGSTSTNKNFTVTITAVNDAPTLNPLSNLSLAQNASQQTVLLSGITAGPQETQTLTVTASSSNTALIPNPSVNYSSPATTGNIKFTPVAGQSGSSTITVTVTDNGGTANGGVDTTSQQFTVTVNAASNHNPVANADTATVSQNSAQTIINVLANDTDQDGDTLTVTNVGATNHGGTAVSVNSGSSIGYTPANGFTGTETFTYAISDGHGGTASATVTVTVNPVAANHAPVAHNDGKTVDENSSATLIDVLANDTDVDGDTLTVTNVGTPNHGGAAAILNSGAAVSYTPASGFSGTETFTYTISDGHGGTANATVTVTVNPVSTNHDPVANADTATVNENSTETFVNVLSNDTDPDSDTLTVTALGATNHDGTVAIRNSGGGVGYTPANGFTGTETFTYTVSDGHGGSATATVTVTVNAVSTGGGGGGGDGGGGSFGGATLLGLAAIGALRRRRR